MQRMQASPTWITLKRVVGHVPRADRHVCSISPPITRLFRPTLRSRAVSLRGASSSPTLKGWSSRLVREQGVLARR
jgi:hypothetical protein